MSVASHTNLNNSGAAKTVVTPHVGRVIVMGGGTSRLKGYESDNSVHSGNSADEHEKNCRFPAKTRQHLTEGSHLIC
eukprot:scaffold220486_cov29-Attheya_sp.AAC.1